MIYRKEEISFEDVPQLSERDKAYQRGDDRLRPFTKYEVSLNAFKQVFEDRSKYAIDRALLVQELSAGYKDISASEATLANIQSLSSEKTFTVITAHQPSLLTGPLYFIYKICSVISLAKQLNSAYPDYHVVPVFVSGGEDHDFEEIATAHLFNQDFTWQTAQVGSTGRMTLDGLGDVLSIIKEKLGASDNASQLTEIIQSAEKQANTYGDFMFYLVNELFKTYGLVIANMDNGKYKSKLLPYVIKDLKEKDSQRSVQKDQEALAAVELSAQAHAREVNIFWFDGDRHRVIANENGTYQIDQTFYTQSELEELLASDPSSISPNVVLRPVYQEVIMPNLAYIGGGGELAYWLERKSLFDTWELPFPMLIRRDSFQIVDKRTDQTLQKSELSFMDLFEREEQLIGKYAHLQSDIEIDLSAEKKSIEDIFTQLKEKVSKIDPTLGKTALSELSKTMKSIDYLQSKMLKAEKNKNEVGINKLKKSKNRLFPSNGLQERYDNFIPYYLKYGQAWIDTILSHADPLNKNFKVLIEE